MPRYAKTNFRLNRSVSDTILLIFLLLIIRQTVCVAGNNSSDNGRLTIRLGSGAPREYSIIAALLYKNASARIDTAGEVSDTSGTDIYFYPRLDVGNSNILRLVLQQSGGGRPRKIDLFLDLGPSLNHSIALNDSAGAIFLNPENRFFGKPLYSKKLNGLVELHESKGGKKVSGNLNISCITPFFRDDRANYIPVQMTGNFSAPAGRFREISLASMAPRKAISRRYRRNLAIAVLLTLGVVIALSAR